MAEQAVATTVGITGTDVDPRTLVVDVNVRTNVKLDKDFLGSIRQHGVLQAVTARRDETGQLRVVLGQRRTLAAVEVGLETIPVRVVEGEDGDVARIVGQIIENHHRAGLDEAEQAAAYEQLAALGVPAASIARKLNTRKATVETALRVQADETAAKALAEHPITLDQAAVIEDFTGDETAVARLIKAAKEGGFDHTARRERDNRAEREAVAAKAAELAKQGVTVVDREATYEQSCATLGGLFTPDGDDLTPEAHASCPGHAAFVEYSRWSDDGTRVVWLCTDWKGNGHGDRSGKITGPMSEEEKIQRREVIANNKAWDSATEVRRNWLKTFLARKSAPKDAGLYVARALLDHSRTVGEAIGRNNQLLVELLGHKRAASWEPSPLRDTIDKATPARAQVLTLGVVLAGVESSLDRWSWRQPTATAADYLNALVSWGYELADVEKIITDHTDE